jgi:hypothetical protein
MRLLIATVLTCTVVFAQRAEVTSGIVPIDPPGTAAVRSVRISVSKQPLSTFIAVLGSKLPGVAGYSARACLATSATAISFSGGRVLQLIEERIPVISYQVAAATAQVARRNSKQYKIYSALSEIAYASTIGLAYLNVGSIAVRIAAPVIGHYAERAKDNLNTQLPDPQALYGKVFLDDGMISLAPGECQTRLFLGLYDSTVTSWATDLELK